jgi:hypothetical protein
MGKKLKLTIELIPSSSWQNNLRDILKPNMWDDIRKKVYKKNNFKCSVCGQKRKLQAHEIWKFNKRTHIQKLVDIVPLCFLCHMVKHIGFASLVIKRPINQRLIKHFMEVNGCNRETFQKELKVAIKNFQDRSRYDWELNLTKLKDFE